MGHFGTCAVLCAGIAGLVSACAGNPPPAPIPAAFAKVGPALDSAELALRSCHEPQVAGPARTAIDGARVHLAAAVGGDRFAALQLPHDLNVVTATLALCAALDRTAAARGAGCHGEARLGMTKAEVERTIWCEPDRIDTSETPAGRREHWVYLPKTQLAGTTDRPVGILTFIGDRLTAIRRSTR